MSTLKLATLATQDGAKSVPMERVAQGTAAAWVNFNGTGTVAIRRSFNVSSITDNGVGMYSLNASSPLQDMDFVLLGSAGGDSSPNHFFTGPVAGGISQSSVAFYIRNDAAYLADPPYISVALFR